MKLEKPNIIEEDKSCNTKTNIQEILQIIKDNGWQHVAILSSGYHILRVEKLYELALQKIDDFKKIKFEFLSAEEIVKKIEPSKYDNAISHYYDSDQAKTRINNEQQGLNNLKQGKYESGEFQLKKKKDD